MSELRFFLENCARDIVEHRIDINTMRDLLKLPTDFYEAREILIEFPRWVRNYYNLWETNPDNADKTSAEIISRVKELLMENLQFNLTCGACPEQYDVVNGYTGDLVAYVRLRFSGLTVECPDCGGALVYKHYFDDDGCKGMFDSDSEREFHLAKIKEAIVEYYKTGKTAE